MNNKKLSGNELIERITYEVQDAELRRQLLDLVLRNRAENSSETGLINMGISPQAVKKNVGLMKGINLFIGIVLFAVGVVGFLIVRDPFTRVLFFAWIVFFPIILLVSNRFFNNIVNPVDDKQSQKNTPIPKEPWETRVYRGSATIPRKAPDSEK